MGLSTNSGWLYPLSRFLQCLSILARTPAHYASYSSISAPFTTTHVLGAKYNVQTRWTESSTTSHLEPGLLQQILLATRWSRVTPQNLILGYEAKTLNTKIDFNKFYKFYQHLVCI